jgi:4-alpha-glucanotransferase
MGAPREAPPPEAAPLVHRQGAPFPAIVGPAELHLEDGAILGADRGLPPDLPLGYHQIRPLDGGPTRRLIVAPARCHLPEGLRAWGWAIQLYALRSRESWGMGDLADLRRLADWSAGTLGAGAIVLNPLHAALPLVPQEPSPYFPSSRRYRNPLYLRVEDVPGADAAGLPVERLAAEGHALNAERRIDRDAVLRLKMAALGDLWTRTSPDPAGLARYRAQQGQGLEEFAIFCALSEHHGSGWRRWPAEHRHPASPAVARFAAERQERVAFHAWLQWLLDDQLARAGRALRLVTDLAIGFDGEGADAWAWQDLLAHGVTVGAPPDDFAPDGQDWGLPPFVPHRLRGAGYAPFIETARAGLRHAGGMRIDHVMGLFRLYWVPGGSTARDGAYVRYPTDALLAILALESERAGALVIGEDLGTVEPGVRERLLAERILSTRVVWFEPGPPADYPRLAFAAVTTHDLPTVRGLWTGSDLREQAAVGIRSNVEGTEALRTQLRTLTGLAADAPSDTVALAVHRRLAEAPSVLIAATLDDALGVAERPNLPGMTAERRANWAIALPETLDQIESDARVRAVGEALGERRARS